MRYYIGVDWADQEHTVWVDDETGRKVTARTVAHTAEGLSAWGRELDEWRAQGIALWAAIERPEGRVVDTLLDHGVVVHPVNPKALDRARDRFRQSRAKDDLFDARVLAAFLRTDHAHLPALQPSSEAAQELKRLTEGYHRLIRQQTRLVNQLTATLKAYYPRALEMVADLTTARARAFLLAFPTPAALAALTERPWRRWAKAQHLSETEADAMWARLHPPHLPVPAHVVRAEARWMQAVLKQLTPVVEEVAAYRGEIEAFFADLPAATWARTLPGGKGASWCRPCGRGWVTRRDAGPRSTMCRPKPGWCRSPRAVASSAWCAFASPAIGSCGMPSTNWPLAPCSAASGRGRTTTGNGRGGTLIAGPYGRWGRSG